MKLFHKLLLIMLALALFTGCRKPKPPVTPVPETTADITVVEPDPPSTEPDPTPQATETAEITPEPTAEVSPETVPGDPDEPVPTIDPSDQIDENGVYDTADEVALYLYTYHHLPSNFMTKKEARKKGWTGGALNKTIKGMCIGGDVYGNYEKTLPKIRGNYYECDIGTLNAKSRGAKRLVWSEYYDIYYTEDHYETFVQLYEGE